ncbi:hypothetical protein SAMN04515647_0618 [Cohaesibacter sp. ES.047]|nr:hypothetical protein SAMN04515647_0618 [Cohaesibacter sp. ES.047]
MRYLPQSEIDAALARGHFERSKQFHSLMSRLFGTHGAHHKRHMPKVRTAV